MQQTGVMGSVAVQARQTVRETEWLLHIAETASQVLGVVGWPGLRSPEIDLLVERFRFHKLLKGLRLAFQNERDNNFLSTKTILRGNAALQGGGLSFDLLVRSSDLPSANNVIRRFTDQNSVLDQPADQICAAGEVMHCGAGGSSTCQSLQMFSERSLDWSPKRTGSSGFRPR